MSAASLACLIPLLAAAAPAAPAGMDEHTAYWVRTLKNHPTPLVRKNAARFLGSMKDPLAVDPLVGALGDPDGAVRAEAARALGYLGNEEAIAPLARAGQKDSDARVRKNAREAAERIRAYAEFLKKKEEKERGKQKK